ncbi:hypothetical protein GCM10023322_46640 [Rugosimonospora acidiphila]|uniref:Uncharacterized protein n=1 Tax=Rugosimonospora acidiphila TaxID=556531 RepID=A0ABP9S3Y2_9ACTN
MRKRALAAFGSAVLGSALLALTFGSAPAFADPGTLASLSFNPEVINGNDSATGVVTLTAAATDDTVVSLDNFDFGQLIAPTSVTVPAGATSTSFTVTARPITTGSGNACIVATTAGGSETSGCLWLDAIGGPKFQNVAYVQQLVAGGSTATGVISLDSVTAGAPVQLTSSNPAVAAVPASVQLPAFKTFVEFPVTTTAVNAPTTVTFTATFNGMTQTSTALTLTPAPGSPNADTVRITKAEWNRGHETIEATSTNPKAQLDIVSNGQIGFTLTSKGGGKFSAQFDEVNRPTSVTVMSTFGGTATAAVKD